MSRFPIEQEPDTLRDYHDELKIQLVRIEEVALALEKDPNDMAIVAELRDIFQQLLLSSTKLELVPIGENLEIMVHVFDFILEHACYPRSFSELLLLFIDQLLLISEDVLATSSIDMLAVQNVHIALQHINLANSPEQLFEGVGKAVAQISTEQQSTVQPVDEEEDILFFDDFDELDAEVTLFDSESEPQVEITLFDDEPEPDSRIDQLTLSSFEPAVEGNPIDQARAFMAGKANDPINILAELSDQLTCHGKRHTLYLQELGLAVNIILGEPVAAEDLWLGLALHDIGLAPMVESLNALSESGAGAQDEYKTHPIAGAALGKRMGMSDEALNVILQHHEAVDGSGYPNGLSGSEISDEGRIAAVVDAFHSRIYHHTHKRTGRSALLDVVEEIKRGSGTKFDSCVVKAFLYCLREYWVPRHVVKVSDSTRTVDFEA